MVYTQKMDDGSFCFADVTVPSPLPFHPGEAKPQKKKKTSVVNIALQRAVSKTADVMAPQAADIQSFSPASP